MNELMWYSVCLLLFFLHFFALNCFISSVFTFYLHSARLLHKRVTVITKKFAFSIRYAYWYPSAHFISLMISVFEVASQFAESSVTNSSNSCQRSPFFENNPRFKIEPLPEMDAHFWETGNIQRLFKKKVEPFVNKIINKTHHVYMEMSFLLNN